MQHLEVLLGQRFRRERLVEQPLLLSLEPRDLDAVPFGLDLLPPLRSLLVRHATGLA